MDNVLSSREGDGPQQQGPQQNQKSQEEQIQEQRQRQEEFKNQVLNQILDQQARARLSTLSLAKPEKAEAVTSLLINMARMGRFGPGAKVDEAQLIDILEKVGSSGGSNMMGGAGGNKTAGVNFTRRALDDDDEDDYAKIMEDL